MTTKITRRVFAIGCGGTGQKVIAKTMDLEKNSESIVYRVYDTDVWAERAHSLRSIFIRANVEKAEMIRKNPHEFPKIADILRLEQIPSITNTEGTGQFISQGMLLFVATLPEFINHIRTAVRPLLSGELPSRLRASGIELADERLYCILVRSCAGGTGSGPHAIITWLLKRELLKLLGQSSRLMLIDLIVLPEPFEPKVNDKLKIYANAGSFLHMMSEYNRDDLPPRKFEFGDHPDLRITVGGGQASDLTILLSNRNLSSDTDRGNVILTEDEVYDQCAHFISLHASTPMISNFYAQFGDIQHETQTCLKNQPTIFSSLGYAEAIFKTKNAFDWIVMSKAKSILEKAVGGNYDV